MIEKKYTIYGMKQYVTIKIIMIQRDLVLSIKVSNTALVFHQAQTYTLHYRSTLTQKKKEKHKHTPHFQAYLEAASMIKTRKHQF